MITEMGVHQEFWERVQAGLDQAGRSPSDETSGASPADARLSRRPGAAAPAPTQPGKNGRVRKSG